MEKCVEPALKTQTRCYAHYISYRQEAVDAGEVQQCSRKGCTRPNYARKVCNAHYPAVKRAAEQGREVFKTRGRGETSIRDEHGRKHCPRCDIWSPEDAFGDNAKMCDGKVGVCRPCIRFGFYNLKRSDVVRMLEEQKYSCAICRKPLNEGTLCVDHDHKCCAGQRSCGECVRGLLCTRCNHGLGHFRDNPERLRLAADYLEMEIQRRETMETPALLKERG